MKYTKDQIKNIYLSGGHVHFYHKSDETQLYNSFLDPIDSDIVKVTWDKESTEYSLSHSLELFADGTWVITKVIENLNIVSGKNPHYDLICAYYAAENSYDVYMKVANEWKLIIQPLWHRQCEYKIEKKKVAKYRFVIKQDDYYGISSYFETKEEIESKFLVKVIHRIDETKKEFEVGA